jgi:hypothetical protein
VLQDTKPFIAVYVVWHPDFAGGKAIAKAIHDHFRRDIFINVGGGTGVSVQFRSAPAAGGDVPLEVDPDEAETSAIIVLLDPHLVGNKRWVAYVQGLANMANSRGLGVRIFPVTIEPGLTTKLSPPLSRVQCIRWDKWSESNNALKRRKLLGALTYELCRMLRCYLEHLKRPGESEEALEKYLEPVRVFLSHSKHDKHGESIALRIRDYIHADVDLASFFDAKNIPPGLNFDAVLEHYVRVSAVVAVQTDSYASREWCRREIIEAKRSCVPLVVVNCITDIEERGFPYLGNVPVVRMSPNAHKRIPTVINRLLDEVFKDFLWRCRVWLVESRGVKAVFLPRAPELISLVARHCVPKLQRGKHAIIYPDPPLGAEEESLLTAIAPKLQFFCYTEWLAVSSGGSP